MNTKTTIYNQTENAYQWLDKLVTVIPEDKWKITPNTLATNITWQVGHLITSIYYHSIMTIRGHHPEVVVKFHYKNTTYNS